MTESTVLNYRVQLFAQKRAIMLKFQKLVKNQVVMSVMSECISVIDMRQFLC